ncbi:hypothetical protein SAMD00019534_118020 [Acytostelium subglobosum LB1]|uniref:hypothetical protein n=1 Tax=Acytostelium subglobosum LB1 TaxID=1410327 RepID=UPI000644CEB3|nr:hypothetical protein SAMD00019534_118020 [Acytostelium subglobosum LB1]GAM28626.1 hypothetical protein SAMD00019534_118020 [Acytostelium subglobosum LB1]|eukprot:XP_012748404.1 hypothetical protein SAMD00019534_118020 [Acytostelium subglobosum LB1]
MSSSWTSSKPSGSVMIAGSSFREEHALAKSTRFFMTNRSDNNSSTNTSAPVDVSVATAATVETTSTSTSTTSTTTTTTESSSSDQTTPTKQQQFIAKRKVLKSFIYNKLDYDHCDSRYDDDSDEAEIPFGQTSWDTNVIVLLPCRHHLKVPGSAHSTIESIRHLAYASAKMQGHRITTDLDSYIFHWNNIEIIFDKDIPIRDLVQYSPTRVINLHLELVEKDNLCKERLIDVQSSEINGGHAYWKTHIEEIMGFNNKIKRLASIACDPQPIENARLTPYPPPPTIPEFFVIKVHFRNQTKSLRCTRNHTAETLMEIVSEKVKKTFAFDPTKWRFLLTGIHQYIAPKVPLLSVDYVVERIKRSGEIELTMVEMSSIGLEQDIPSLNLNSSISTGRRSAGLNNKASPIIDIIFARPSAVPSKARKITNVGTSSMSPDQSPVVSALIADNLILSDIDQSTTASALDVKEHFKVRILHAHDIDSSLPRQCFGTDPSNIVVYMEVGIYFGGELLGPMATSSSVAFQDTVVWNDWLTIPIPISMIPKGARICFSLNAKYKDQHMHLGWVGHRLYDSINIFNTSTPYSMLLWHGKVNPIGTCVDNLQSKYQAVIIAFEFYDYVSPLNIHYPNLLTLEPTDTSALVTVTPDQEERINVINKQDPLYQLCEEERVLLWNSRYYCQTVPNTLPKLLQSLQWTNPSHVAEIFRLLRNWPLMSPVDALELLDPKFADCVEIREYVVKCLDAITDYELDLYMLQLVQALKHDVFHGSVLSLFLLGRVFQNTAVLAHSFFWHLKADSDNPEVCERFRLLISSLLRYKPHLSETFKQQIQALKVFEHLAKQVKDIPYEKRRNFIEEYLKEDRPAINNLCLPFDPSIRVTDVIPDKCKAMDSAKVPLWISYKNADSFAHSFQMIVKTGDDLRQDILTLQLLKLMDHMWKSEGLDLHMTIYRCIATGLGSGLIEVVNNAETAARIQASAGGMTGVFKQTPIANWLKNHNLTENNYQKAVTKFTLSCAGYCVATYVLGIGDRHNDNIMVDKFGHLFHIDFGHFLGNFKTFAGFQREKAPFVLTPDFVYVIGNKDSPNFDFFVQTCCKAYNILRRKANIFFNMFELMLSTGIPELRSESDILYLRDKFRLDLSDQEASDRFTKLIHESINTLTTQINFAIHIMAHRKAIGDDRKSDTNAR